METKSEILQDILKIFQDVHDNPELWLCTHEELLELIINELKEKIYAAHGNK